MLRCLDLTQAVKTGDLLAAIAQHSSRLEALELERSNDITPGQFQAVAVNCPLLLSVSLFEVMVSHGQLQPLFSNCKNLQVLVVVCPFYTFTDETLSCVAQNCVLLHKLHLRACLSITDDGLGEVLKSCVELRHLYIHSNILLTDATLHSIARHCSNLTYLSMRGRFQYSHDSLSAVSHSCAKLQQVLISTGRRNLNLPLREIFDAHVELEFVVERVVRYDVEHSDEEHAKFAAEILNHIGGGDY
eukprot:gene16695-19039_t